MKEVHTANGCRHLFRVSREAHPTRSNGISIPRFGIGNPCFPILNRVFNAGRWPIPDCRSAKQPGCPPVETRGSLGNYVAPDGDGRALFARRRLGPRSASPDYGLARAQR
jgi:hypothetical protein